MKCSNAGSIEQQCQMHVSNTLLQVTLRAAHAGHPTRTASDAGVHVQYGELQALASMQSLLGQHAQAADSLKQAKALQERTLQLLWRPDMQFLGTYKTQPPASYVMPPSNSRWQP